MRFVLFVFFGAFNVWTALLPGSAWLTALDWATAVFCFAYAAWLAYDGIMDWRAQRLAHRDALIYGMGVTRNGRHIPIQSIYRDPD